MRNIPVDTSQITLLASGKLMPKPFYAELSDGSRKRDPHRQAVCPVTGVPLWIVDCFVDDEEEDGRAEVVGVTVPSMDRPVVKKFSPVPFEGLVATGYVRDGRVQFSFRADRIITAALKAAAS